MRGSAKTEVVCFGKRTPQNNQMHNTKSLAQCLGFCVWDVRDSARQAKETAGITWTTLHGSTGIIDSDWLDMSLDK
jgi:hypothetical protein